MKEVSVEEGRKDEAGETEQRDKLGDNYALLVSENKSSLLFYCFYKTACIVKHT